MGMVIFFVNFLCVIIWFNLLIVVFIEFVGSLFRKKLGSLKGDDVDFFIIIFLLRYYLSVF